MYLYLVEMRGRDSDELFHKIGVTARGVKERFAYGKNKVLDDASLSLIDKFNKLRSGEEYLSDTPYLVKELHCVKYHYEGDALIGERDLLNALKKHRYKPNEYFSGISECFKANDEQIIKIKKIMDRHSAKKNNEAPDELLYKLRSSQIKRVTDPIEKHEKILELCAKTA